MTALQTCTDSPQAFGRLAKIEQQLSVRKSVESGEFLSQQGEKMEIIRQIIRIVEFFLKVTGKELEVFQIQILAGDLYEKFQKDTLEDIILMFKKARQGDFGKVFKLDTFTIMEWTKTYLEYKREECIKILNKSYKQETKNEGKYFHELPQEMQDEFNKKMNAILEKGKEPRIENREPRGEKS